MTSAFDQAADEKELYNFILRQGQTSSQLTQNNDRRAMASASHIVHQATFTQHISTIAKSAYHAGSLPLHATDTK
jgi:hypothetical protein